MPFKTCGGIGGGGYGYCRHRGYRFRGGDGITDMEKAIELLSRLDETIRCTHLDMGGNDRYSLTLKSYPIIKEIKLYLIQADCHVTSKCSLPIKESK